MKKRGGNIPFTDYARRFPPILVRLLANHPKKHVPRSAPLTDEEIAQASGLSAAHVYYLSHATDWKGIDFPTMIAFIRGCNVDFENAKQMKRVSSYLRIKPRPTWQTLRKSPLWKPFFDPLIRRYLESVRPTSPPGVHT